MIGYRITVVVLLAMVTACMTCSSLFPLFRHNTYNSVHWVVRRSTVYYWYIEVSVPSSSGVVTTQRQYTRDVACSRMSVFYIWGSSLAVAAAGCGGLATLLGAAWVSVGRSVALSVEVFLLSVLAFACSGAALGLMSYAYCGQLCSEVSSPRESDFGLVEGFILLCVAVGGFLVLTVMQAIGFCCGCQMGPRVMRRTMNEVAREPVDGVVRGAVERPRRTVVMGQDATHMYAGTGVAPPRANTAGSARSSEGVYPYLQKK